MFGIVISETTGFVVDRCVITNEYSLKDDEKIIGFDFKFGNPISNMNKPKWTGSEWVDTEPLPPVEQLPSEEDEMTRKMSALEKENSQLWDTVDFLLKSTGLIPTEEQVNELINT